MRQQVGRKVEGDKKKLVKLSAQCSREADSRGSEKSRLRPHLCAVLLVPLISWLECLLVLHKLLLHQQPVLHSLQLQQAQLALGGGGDGGQLGAEAGGSGAAPLLLANSWWRRRRLILLLLVLWE
jgi:hypothetical protein